MIYLGDLKIDVKITDPNGKELLNLENESIYFHQLTADVEGSHYSCRRPSILFY